MSAATTYKLSEGECIPDEDLKRERIGKVNSHILFDVSALAVGPEMGYQRYRH